MQKQVLSCREFQRCLQSRGFHLAKEERRWVRYCFFKILRGISADREIAPENLNFSEILSLALESFEKDIRPLLAG